MRTRLLLLLTLILSSGCLTHGHMDVLVEDSYVPKKRELEYVQIITTNGLFTPLELYPNSENSIKDLPDGFGELTKLGKLQHYELGKVLRDYYKDFITSSPIEIDAFSSVEDRSTHSLLCLLASLYAPTPEWEFLPGFKWQPIPVSYLDDNDIFFRYEENCVPQVNNREKIYNTSPGKEFIARDKFYYSYWANHSGLNIENWDDVANLYDILDREKQLGLKVPRWANKYWYDLKSISDAAHGWNYQTVSSLQLKIGPLLDLITSRMKARALLADPVKVSIYMTHDWNLSAFLSAIRRYNGFRPPPCATVAIELHNEDDENFYVQMRFFNATHPESGYQEPHTLTLQECSEFCPLQNFTDFFKPVIPEDFNRMCVGFVEYEKSIDYTN